MSPQPMLNSNDAYNLEFYSPMSASHVELLISPHCPHCEVLLEEFSRLIKSAEIGRLEVINVVADPERAAELRVRSVPWFRLGEFEFEGVHTSAEIRSWLPLVGTQEGVMRYLSEELKQGHLFRLEKLVQEFPHWALSVLRLLQQEDLEMSLRLGASALMESLQEHEALKLVVPALIEWLASSNPHHRCDALHYIGLSGETRLIPLVKSSLHDSNAEVREIAAEALEALEALLDE